jgi:hypothetical protein
LIPSKLLSNIRSTLKFFPKYLLAPDLGGVLSGAEIKPLSRKVYVTKEKAASRCGTWTFPKSQDNLKLKELLVAKKRLLLGL